MPEKDADDWDECPESVRIEKDMNAQYNALNKKKKKLQTRTTAPGIPRWSPTPVLTWRSEA